MEKVAAPTLKRFRLVGISCPVCSGKALLCEINKRKGKVSYRVSCGEGKVWWEGEATEEAALMGALLELVASHDSHLSQENKERIASTLFRQLAEEPFTSIQA